MQTIVIGLLVIALFWRLPDPDNTLNPENQRVIWDKIGLLYMCAIIMFMLSLLPMVLIFPTERSIFNLKIVKY